MERTALNGILISGLDSSVTPFHAVRTAETRLRAAGFVELDFSLDWQINPGGRYYVTRNQSSLIAFQGADPKQHGWRLVGAHTDSPGLRIKPVASAPRLGYVRLGVEVYGGALLNPWFDRDLSLAGRLHVRDRDGSLRSVLIDCRRPLMTIPSLAIHLDREVNQKRSINAQTDLPPLLTLGEVDFASILLAQAIKDGGGEPEEVLDYELCLYDTQGAALVGLNAEFLASARLDNLVSCFVALQALIDSPAELPNLVVLNDHEEIGSQTHGGAQGPFLESVLQRITPADENLAQTLEKSLLVSADNAHGIHPNFPERHDDKHGPILNRGPVLKVNANQRYATTSETAALLRQAARKAQVPLQSFVSRADMACGSTIGPITAARLGIKTVDIGIPQFAMHSIRELCGAEDPHHLYRLLKTLLGER